MSLEYDGKVTTTGTSQAIRIEKHFFDACPEFEQKAHVKVYPIGRGTALLSVDEPILKEETEDPIFDAFLSFLEQDIMRNPQNLTQLPEDEFSKVENLLDGVDEVSDDEEMPDDFEL